jgi:hypothetical protein
MSRRLAAVIGATAGIALGVIDHDAKAHVPGCHSTACDRRIHQKRRSHWCRTHPVCVWKHRFLALPSGGRHWARCVSFRESRNHRIARASGFLSYFQWTLPTWHSAGGDGNPEYTASWYEQAVRAWHWHLTHPTGQWPNTGERGICGG